LTLLEAGFFTAPLPRGVLGVALELDVVVVAVLALPDFFFSALTCWLIARSDGLKGSFAAKCR
jgi:hypothetical protein